MFCVSHLDTACMAMYATFFTELSEAINYLDKYRRKTPKERFKGKKVVTCPPDPELDAEVILPQLEKEGRYWVEDASLFKVIPGVTLEL